MSRRDLRSAGRQLARVRVGAELALADLDGRVAIEEAKARGLGYIADAASDAYTASTARARQLAQLVPDAAEGLSAINAALKTALVFQVMGAQRELSR